jgi:hypothetical protein
MYVIGTLLQPIGFIYFNDMHSQNGTPDDDQEAASRNRGKKNNAIFLHHS